VERRYRQQVAKKNDPVYQADCRKALRVGGYPENEYWMLPLAWGFVRNFELDDSYRGQWN
jgi:hypothetical protein